MPGADIDNETGIKLVSDTVTAILTRLQSECWEWYHNIMVSGNLICFPSLSDLAEPRLRVETRR